jgi:hypothetical protein
VQLLDYQDPGARLQCVSITPDGDGYVIDLRWLHLTDTLQASFTILPAVFAWRIARRPGEDVAS